MLDIFEYSFMVRGLVAGLIVGGIAPLVGMFLVLRRYSLIADTLAHVSLAGIAIGVLTGIHPMLSATGATVLSSFGIEALRTSRRVYGESALSLFLSGSLSLALVLLALSGGTSVNILSYLFGSIVTVTSMDIAIIAALAVVVITCVVLFYKEFVYATFDEDSARISGIPVRFLNILLILLSALVVSLSIPIVGVLLIAALVVIPSVTALQFRKGFLRTVLIAEVVSLVSVVLGIVGSFYLNIPASATIVLVMLSFFMAAFFINSRS